MDYSKSPKVELYLDCSLSYEDARTISNITLADEYNMLEQVFGWRNVHFKKCNTEAIEHAFTIPDVKAKIRKQIEEGYS